jgi:hypothetical protein
VRFYDLPKFKVRNRKTDVPTSAVEVVGPLGRAPRISDVRNGILTCPQAR